MTEQTCPVTYAGHKWLSNVCVFCGRTRLDYSPHVHNLKAYSDELVYCPECERFFEK